MLIHIQLVCSKAYSKSGLTIWRVKRGTHPGACNWMKLGLVKLHMRTLDTLNELDIMKVMNGAAWQWQN